MKLCNESRKSSQIFAIAVSMAGGLCGQTALASAFDAVSVKFASPLDAAAMMSGTPRRGIRIDAGMIDIPNTSLFDVIAGAYRLKDYQLSGSESMKAVRVDIVNTLPSGTSQDDIPENASVSAGETLWAEDPSRDQRASGYAWWLPKAGPN